MLWNGNGRDGTFARDEIPAFTFVQVVPGGVARALEGETDFAEVGGRAVQLLCVIRGIAVVRVAAWLA